MSKSESEKTMPTWDERNNFFKPPTHQHTNTANDLEQDLNALLKRFRFEINNERTRRAIADAAATAIARYIAEGHIPETIADDAKRVRVRQDPLNPSAFTIEISDALRYWLITGRLT